MFPRHLSESSTNETERTTEKRNCLTEEVPDPVQELVHSAAFGRRNSPKRVAPNVSRVLSTLSAESEVFRIRESRSEEGTRWISGALNGQECRRNTYKCVGKGVGAEGAVHVIEMNHRDDD